MIVYLENKAQFREDVFSNRIEEIVHDAVKKKLGRSVGQSELNSWKNSLRCMSDVLEDKDIPHDAGVAIEYAVPNTAKRIDLIITGTGADGGRTAIIVELKQWQDVKTTMKDGMVSTYLGGPDRETTHPSYQAWTYAMLIKDFNENVRLDPIQINPCAYLHNCDQGKVINAKRYENYTREAPAFLKDDAQKLREFIKSHVKHGDAGETMFRMRDGKIRPSKGLADHLASLLQGNQEFYMIDDQKVVYETALALSGASSAGHKNVLIVNGGPGTGKSVVAINLLVEITQRGEIAQYVTKNSAPRAVYQSKLAGKESPVLGRLTKARISNLFVGSGGYTATKPDTFNTLIVDEAHRLNEKSGLFSNLGENQIKEIINAASCAVFFIDESQRIHWKDIGDNEQIRHWAQDLGAQIIELDLTSQFRCNGSDGYLAWVDDVLQIRDTANQTLDGANYEFMVCESASEMRDLIYHQNQENNKARMVAGYCWDWITKKKDPDGYDITFPAEDFKARWNLDKDGSLWIMAPDSVKEVGCIHTCQGLELDYVGVIIGSDFLVRNGEVVTEATNRSSQDRSIHGYKKLLKADPDAAKAKADEIIKNTYRTLMTRGMKGCYVFSNDPETNSYLQAASIGALIPDLDSATVAAQELDPEETPTLPFRVLDESEVKPYVNSVPKFDIKIAAGSFSPDQWLEECDWVELPEHFSPKEGYFVAQVIGESMNRRIANGSWCLFKSNVIGSRNGKIVLVQHRNIQDPDNGGQFTIKRYSSQKTSTDEGWSHSQIQLHPDSLDTSFQPLTLEASNETDLQVVGEFIAIV
jgi:DUF2075 family protein